jgi:hypothetical protein
MTDRRDDELDRMTEDLHVSLRQMERREAGLRHVQKRRRQLMSLEELGAIGWEEGR